MELTLNDPDMKITIDMHACQLAGDIESCEKIFVLNSFKIAWPPPCLPPAIFNPNFPHQVNNNEKFAILNLTTGSDPFPRLLF